MKRLLLSVLSVVLLSGCSVPSLSEYQNYYKLDGQYLQKRHTETRRFEAKSEEKLLEAVAQALQDAGFMIEEGDVKLGLITASQDWEVSSTGTRVLLSALATVARNKITVGTDQKIYITLVTTKSADKKGYNVRVNFTRLDVDTDGNVKGREVTDPEIYQEFFDELSRVLSLTANSI